MTSAALQAGRRIGAEASGPGGAEMLPFARTRDPQGVPTDAAVTAKQARRSGSQPILGILHLR